MQAVSLLGTDVSHKRAHKSNSKVANSLVAMSSAAVLAVYSAGYIRTRSASGRFAAQAYARQLVPENQSREAASEVPPAAPNRPARAPEVVRAPEAVRSTKSEPAQASPEIRTLAAAGSAGASQPAATSIAIKTTAALTRAEKVRTTAPDAARAVSSTAPAIASASTATVDQSQGESPSDPASASAVSNSGNSGPAITSSATASAATASIASAASSATPAPASAAPATASITPASAATASAKPAAPVWKDGKYSAWGTCQHGDIQATVVIQSGKIVSAAITDCQTRYSCDIIDSLPPKVITRQKAHFDAIGGATESAYAYYGAVYWALDQASK